ncbi:hypothetical protein ED733_008443 [Metarhizium rileyi]|uniref:Uncharacterized protein n=1 Tax=Metarhizium rileyi (strain RCEF 4871) TaxID=1649241 RepID=A0A5C6GII3_METRR|nr:hypothetical protein ED733_008443 [Metarhizium rileyi]
MPSFVTVNNNVSLISITVAPSTWLATVIVVFVLLALCLPKISFRIPRFALPRLPSLPSLPALASAPQRGGLYIVDKPLPPHPQGRQLCLKATTSPTDMVDPLDGLDASLRDFEPPVSPISMRHSSALPSEPATEYLEDSDIASVGGYSPPAWRRLGNGDRSSGFWKQHPHLSGQPRRFLRGTSPGLEEDGLEGDEVLQQAIRTRLPAGSQSPEKRRSPSPGRGEDATLRVDNRSPTAETTSRDSPGPDNYFRFAVRAEVQQRTKPIEAAISFTQQRYRALVKSWVSVMSGLLVAFLSISTLKMLVKPAAPRPVGDLVKVAGIARSFEPLIYFSEPAVAHVKDLQSTSIAVWDLAESVRVSGMSDAAIIVSNLDSISEAMKKLVLELTKFHTHVDGDIDSILSVMEWAKMHLDRLNSRPPTSSLSHAYDNIHNFLTSTAILEDTHGHPTRIGRLTTSIFGMSNPQREQRMVQLLFNSFLSTLEEAIQAELENSVSLFALFDDIDAQFLKLARTVAHESSTQEEFQAELLSGLWARILGPRATELRKFEKNRALLHDVRHKTVRNKGNLVGHHGKLLTLKSSLESLRGKLASQLVRGLNSSTLTLEDQIHGIVQVRDYLSDVRSQQKTKVMETLYSIDRSHKYVSHEVDAGYEIGAGPV